LKSFYIFKYLTKRKIVVVMSGMLLAS